MHVCNRILYYNNFIEICACATNDYVEFVELEIGPYYIVG